MVQIIYRLLTEDRDYQARAWTPNFPGCSQQRRTEQVA